MAAPTPSICRLCITKCNDDFKSLYNEHGQANGLYEMTYEYFHPKIVDLEKAKHLTTICLQCFRHIHDFHSFQTSVIIAQLKLIEEDKTIYSTISEEIETQQPEIRTPTTMAIKIEKEEFMEFIPEYIVENDCPQIIKKEFITLPDIEIKDSSPSTSQNHNLTIGSLSVQGGINVEEDRKNNISLPPLEITDIIDTGSLCTSDDEMPLAKVGGRKPAPLSKNRSTHLGVDNHKTSFDQRAKRPETLKKLLTKWIPDVQCVICSSSFRTWLALKRHFRRQHPNEKFYYKCCSREFTCAHIRDHLILHEDPDAFKCVICGVRYTTNHSLLFHNNLRHPESLKFPCDKCDKRCNSKAGLVNHQYLAHSLESLKFPCDKCDKRCNSKAGLVNHQYLAHSFDKQYLSELQKDPTGEDNNETMQNRTLHTVDPEEDGKDDSSLSIRETDSIFHVKDEEEDSKDNISLPPLEIMDVADTGTSLPLDDSNASNPTVSKSRRSESVVSQRTDDQESSYDQPQKNHKALENLLAKWIPNIKCFKCSKSFPSWSFVKGHFKQQHPNDKFYYKCCSRQFGQLTIKDHLRLHEDPDVFKCSICDKRFINGSNLTYHCTEMHPESAKFWCDKCDKTCTSKIGLAIHYTRMHRKDLPTNYHTPLPPNTEDNMETEKCGNSCTSKIGLAKHYSMVHRKDLPDLPQINHSPPPPPYTEDNMETENDKLGESDAIYSSDSRNCSLDGVVIEMIDNQKSSSDQLQEKDMSLGKLLAKWIPNMKCYKCKKSFPSWSLFRKHFKSRHPSEEIVFICCSRKFTRYYIRDHLYFHSDPNAFKCSICGKRYMNNNSLSAHYNERHPGSLMFPCDICSKRFVSIHAMSTHQAIKHNFERQDQSPQPPSNGHNVTTTIPGFVQDSKLQKDLCHPQPMSEGNKETTEHLDIQDSSCGNTHEEVDNKDNISLPPLEIMDAVSRGSTFTSDDEIPLAQIDDGNPSVSKYRSSNAVVTQTSGKKHDSLADLLAKWIPTIQCFKCSKTFLSWPLVKFHFKRQHPKEEFYFKCCSRKFKQSMIKNHLRLHSNPNAFKCSICEKRYASSTMLSNHYADKHPENLKIQCDICGKHFMAKAGLATHYRKIHQTNRKDHANIQLLADGRTAYTCQLCGETKYSKSNFRLHKIKMHGRTPSSKFVCTICGRWCTSLRFFREHVASHENKKLYKCAYCPRTYGTIAAVRFHRTRNHSLESNSKFYIDMGEITNDQNDDDSESQSTSAKSTLATEKEVDAASTCDLQDSMDIIKMDHTTMAKLKTEDVNTEWETSFDGEIDPKYSDTSVTNASMAAIKNDDFGEECASTSSMARAANDIENKSKKRSTRTQLNVRLPLKRGKRSRFGNQRK